MQQTELWTNSTARRNRQIYWCGWDFNTHLSKIRRTAGNNLWSNLWPKLWLFPMCWTWTKSTRPVAGCWRGLKASQAGSLAAMEQHEDQQQEEKSPDIWRWNSVLPSNPRSKGKSERWTGSVLDGVKGEKNSRGSRKLLGLLVVSSWSQWYFCVWIQHPSTFTKSCT